MSRPPLRRTPVRVVVAASSIALAVTGLSGLLAGSASANPSGSGLVLEEVYGGGGNSGATYTNDYVELFNPTSAPISLSGLSLQYRSATSTSAIGATNVNALTGQVAAHGHWLVQESKGTAGTTPLPSPDDTTGTLALSGTGGEVFLVNGTAPISPGSGSIVAGNSLGVIDMLGWGATTTTFEGAAGPATTNTTADARVANGTDTDNNAADFTAGAPNPKGSASDSTSSTPTPVSVASIGNQTATVGTAFSFTPTATGGTAPVTWTATGLPSWASIDAASGKITGTPDATGTASVTVTAKDSATPATTSSQTFTLTTGPAATGGASHVLISQVWGDGGYNGAPFTNDYIELFNPTSAPISLAGDSIQYGAYNRAAGAALSAYPITGTIPANGHFLIAGAAGTNGSALPTPDATISLDLNYEGSFVALVDTTAPQSPPSGNMAGTAHFIDSLGYGDANTFEGADQGTDLGTDTAALRSPENQDTDNNHTDFTTGAPAPVNSAGSTGGSTTGTGTNVGTKTIAQIQGTTDASPLAGDTVTTTGVVTGDYSTGGFNGFYMETGGAGGTEAQDATPGASDGIFVYGSAAAAQVKVGDSVQVSGTVQEYYGETEITSPTVAELTTALPAVVPDQIPWTDLSTDAGKEAHEGELMAPQGDFTVTDNYNTNFYGEIELAAGDQTLMQPTNAGTPGSSAAQTQAAYNLAHQVFLDDGSSWTYNATSHATTPLPWLTGSPVSIGSKATFHQPVVLDYRNSQWNFEPQQQVTGDGSAVATFSDMRTAKAAPDAVGGAIKLATFNVENFFPTTGDAFVADNTGATCSTYKDKDGNEEEVNDCTFANGDAGPRGAATAAAFQRQLSKIVYGINHLGASIVSLEELENGAKFTADVTKAGFTGDPRDYSISTLVDALNTAAGSKVWSYVPSPAAADLPPTAEQDVIRTGFIYKAADVAPVGVSHVLTGDSDAGQPFSIAREPLAQGFKAAGVPDSDAFMVVANHMKSKGTDASGQYSDCGPGGTIGATTGATNDTEVTDPANDQGGFNCTRVHEAHDMWAWAQKQATALNTSRIFLVGDFNAYDNEDPITYLKSQGFTDLGSKFDPTHSSYSYDGLEGSLDHVMASPAALAMVTGATIWQINAQESVGDDYSRYDYNSTNLFDANTPWYASDHDPEIVGINPPAPATGATISAPNTTVTFGQADTVKATLSGVPSAPTGTMTLTEGSTSLGSSAVAADGTASFTLAAGSLAAGTHTLTVTYTGSDVAAPVTATTTVTVNKATATVTGTKASVTVGKAAAVRVSVSGSAGATPTGSVTLLNGKTTVGTATLSAGTATVTVRAGALAAGSHALTISYAGDSDYAAATGTVSVTVAKAAAKVKGSLSGKAMVGKRATIKVTVTGPSGVTATGTVSVTVGGKKFTAKVSRGHATAHVTFTRTGRQTVRISYGGNASLKSASATLKVSVAKKAGKKR